MKIAQSCFSDSWGGLEIVPLKWGRFLTKNNFDNLYLIKQESPLESRLIEQSLKYKSFSLWNKYWTLGLSNSINNICQNEGVDVIIAHRSSDLWNIAPFIKPNHKPRLIFVNHILSDSVNKKDWFHQRIYNKVDAVIALSEIGKQFFIKTTNFNEDKIKIIPNGIETEVFEQASSKRQEIRDKLGLTNNESAIFLVGRIDPLKGQREFLMALPDVVKKFPAVKAFIIGEPTIGEGDEYYSNLKQAVVDLQLKDKVKFLGFQKDVAPFYAAADLFIMPSYHETFGLVLIEAMASRVPVIATNTGSPPEILEQGKYGLLIPPKNSEAISNALISYLNSPQKMTEFGENGYQHVQKKYKLKIIMNQILELCSNMIH